MPNSFNMEHREIIKQLTGQILGHKIYSNLAPYLVKSWLNKNVGVEWDPIKDRNGNWAVFWIGRVESSSYVYLFAEHHHAMWFVLKWA